VNDELKVKLADFGMAKKLEGIMNTQVGTPITMAPEVYHGKYDEKVDIWSVLFYHLF
jgi:serine/threonine protein kinase